MIRYLFIISILIAFISQIASGQEVQFKHLTINDGLSQNAVIAMTQDSRGFMWFGTKDGLNKYDGYSFTIYQHDAFDSTTISENYITTLFEDSRGILWIGTSNGELNCFYRETETFQRVNYSESHNNSKSMIQAITEDKFKNIWIGTREEGVYRLKILFNDEKVSVIDSKQFEYSKNHLNSLSNNLVSSLFTDSQGILWAGTENGLNRFDSDKENFVRYDIHTKNPEAQSFFEGKGISSIYESKAGVLWLGTLSGLVKFNRQNGSYKLYPHQFEVYRYGWGVILSIIEDFSGKLWLSTPAVLMRFDPASLRYDYFKNDPFNNKSISYNSISSSCVDKTGILWFGTSGMGISFFDPKINRFSNFSSKKDTSSRTSSFSISSVLEDKYGFVWMGTAVLSRWNRNTGELKSYETSSNFPEAFGNVAVWSIIESSNGYIWFGTQEGLYRYDPQTEKAKHYKFDPKEVSDVKDKRVCTVFEDRDGNIWTVTENFISRLIDADKGIFQHIRYNFDPDYSELVRAVVYQDNNGIFWLGTKNGLIRFDYQNQNFKKYINDPKKSSSLNNNLIKSLCPDPFQPDKFLWIGTGGGGLNQFNIEEETFKHFTEKNGLPNNVVYGILPDDMGNLWLSTNKGLSRFNITESRFRNFNVSDGLQSNEFNTGAYFKSKNGEMFFGGIYGLNYFYPKNIVDNPFIPDIVITDFRIPGSAGSESESTIRNLLTTADEIIISYSNNIIEFEFAALDYSAPEKNQYAYKLENFHDAWIYSGTVRTATFTNLSPGEYVFRVKGSNNDGVWNEAGTSVKIIITPPWWRTLWAYFLFGLVFLSGLYFVRRYEMNRLILKNQLKLEKVETDTLRKLDQLKSHFFANISHEFRTPLTLILGQIDNVMSSDIDNREKGKLQVANRNARRLLTLINQLLDLSKLEAGSMELTAEQHNIVSFLKSLFFSFESLAEAQKITLKFESDYQNIPVVFDPDKMEKVFYNLISNAFKFTPENGEIKVSITVRHAEFISTSSTKWEIPKPVRDDNTKDTVEISVKDSGIGIPADRLPHIFDRFYQVDSSTTREHEGTGIGLALTKELVELHKGKITVNSKEDEGTVFTLILPLGDFTSEKESLINLHADKFSQESISDDLKITDPHSEEFYQNQKSDKEKTVSVRQEIILIVEDNSDVRSYIHEQLQTDYKIIEASNGEEGITEAQDVIPDLIITDVMMPKMDGYQFTKAIRKDEKTSHIPIIMLTAKAGLDDKIEGLESGIDAYLTKPFSAKELKVSVRNLIQQRNQLRKRFSKATVIKPSEVSAISADQVFLNKTVSLIEAHFEDEEFSVDILAEKVNMSVSQLNRKLNALINQPPGQLIRSLRLQRAADLLIQKTGTVAEICYKVGFNDQAYFSRAFKKQFGVSPSEYKAE